VYEENGVDIDPSMYKSAEQGIGAPECAKEMEFM
jgi:hypothetical protein